MVTDGGSAKKTRAAKTAAAMGVAAKAAGGKKRTKKAPKLVEAADLKSFTSAFTQGLVDSWTQEYGGNAACMVGEADRLAIGLPLPSFCLEYLLQLTAFPLGRMMQIVGVEGTMKSALLFEIVRWFRANHGVGVLLEHESKFSSRWARSIVGWDDPHAFSYVACESINDWQKKMLEALREGKKAMLGTSSAPGPGKVWPMLIGVDSLTAKGMEETQAVVDKQGFSGRSFPLEALSITGFMRTVPQKILAWPISIIGINHLKPSTDQRGIVQRNKAGGRGLSFQETLEIEIKKGEHNKIKAVDHAGRRFVLKTAKNSMGPDQLEIGVDVIWHYEDVFDPMTGEVENKQVTSWDWHSATINMLMKQDTSTRIGKETKKIVDLKQINKGALGNMIVSKRLGITEDDPLRATEAGAILMQNADVVNELRKLYGVMEIKSFAAGIDYDRQLAEMKRDATKRLAVPTKKAVDTSDLVDDDVVDMMAEDQVAAKRRRELDEEEDGERSPSDNVHETTDDDYDE